MKDDRITMESVIGLLWDERSDQRGIDDRMFMESAIGCPWNMQLEHLFIYSTISVKLRKKMPIMKFMEDLFHEVRFYCKNKIDQAVNYLKNCQFRFSQIRKAKNWIKIEQTG